MNKTKQSVKRVILRLMKCQPTSFTGQLTLIEACDRAIISGSHADNVIIKQKYGKTVRAASGGGRLAARALSQAPNLQVWRSV